MDALAAHRFQFAFTITYHYLFPQLTMGLALLLAVLWTQAHRGHPAKRATARRAAHFWSKIFALNFVMGVITGIPMEFQFGTNWARFSGRTGEIIGQTLAMEGVFAFFLESSFIYMLLFAEKRLSPRVHLACAWSVALGTWLSGWFIVCTHAFMQHPQGYSIRSDGTFALTSLSEYLGNPWTWIEYAHTMLGSLVTACTVMSAAAAFYLLRGVACDVATHWLGLSTRVGLIAALALAFPTGDLHSKAVAKHQPVTFAAMEGHFHSESGAGLTLLGQPNMEKLELDNPLVVPKVLSFMTHARWDAEIPGLSSFPRDLWPTNVPLLYYAYHIMVGLGTFFIALYAWVNWQAWRGRLLGDQATLWALMLAFPFPYIANTAGWMTAEVGRQPWLVYGLLRTADGTSLQIAAGTVYFSLLGFMGMYSLLSLLYLGVTGKILVQGPQGASE